MNDKRNERWRELSWRHSLPPAERERRRAWLADHPESRAEWEVEAGLTEALDRLPNVPVSSNFTSLVMRQIEREASARAPHAGVTWFVWSRRPRWLPKIGFAAILVGAGLISYHHQVLAVQRAAVAQSVVTVSGVASLPSPRFLKDFDAIRALDQTPPDVELLRLLK